MSQGSWSTRFPVYQIDFQAVASGKHIASTKRKVRWRFGFPNKQALDAGRTGVECRGEEHDIVIIWSITSGKRQVYMDGTEIHFSTSRASTFQYSWSARGNHVIKVIAHAAPPMQPTPGFRQYDLYVDGQSFFNMPKAYELGLKGPIASHDRVPGSYGYTSSPPSHRSSGIRIPSSREEEETELQRAINASLQESRQYLANKEQYDGRNVPPVPAPTPPAIDLMDFAGQPEPPSLPSYVDSQSVVSYNTMPNTSYVAPPPGHYTQPAAYQQSPGYASQPPPAYQSLPPASNALVPSGGPSQPYALRSAPAYQQPPAASSSYAAPPFAPTYGAVPYAAPGQPSPAYGGPLPPHGTAPVPRVATGDLFAPPPVDPFAPAPPAAGDPYGLYQPMPAYDDPFAPKPPPLPTRADITKSILNAYGPPAQPPPGLFIQQPGQHLPITDGGQSQASGAASGLVLSMNGGFTAGAAEPEKPLSEMEKAMKRLVNIDRIDEPAQEEFTLSLKKKEEDRKTKDGKSKGLPPVATGIVGSNATLEHIKQVKPHTPKTGEGIMKAPPQLFHPDAVNAGALVVHGQGPPPIQRGFGIGYGSPPPNFQQRW